MSIEDRSFRITPLSNGDWPDFAALFAKSFSADVYYPLAERILSLCRLMPLNFTSNLLGQVYLLRCENLIVGFVILKRHGRHKMHLHYLAVSELFRRHGLGRRLMEFACREADRCGLAISLETAANNPAVHLYQQMRFVEQWRLPDYMYLGGDTAFENASPIKWQVLPPVYCDDPFSLPGQELTSLSINLHSICRYPLSYFRQLLLNYRQYTIAALRDNQIYAIISLIAFRQKPLVVGHFRTLKINPDLLVEAFQRLPIQFGRLTKIHLIDSGNDTESELLQAAGYRPGPGYLGMLRQRE